MKTTQPRKQYLALLTFVIALSVLAVSINADNSRSTLTAGQMAPAFQAKTIDGGFVKVPANYKGKIVLVDFWATWCGPCRKELPNVSAAYQKYHAKGFEVVSVSLDHAGVGPEVQNFTRQNNMPWPQVYDGQYWKAAVAVEYGVHAIPCPVLVDGDSGKIVAIGVDALGRRLPQEIEKYLAAKGVK